MAKNISDKIWDMLGYVDFNELINVKDLDGVAKIFIKSLCKYLKNKPEDNDKVLKSLISRIVADNLNVDKENKKITNYLYQELINEINNISKEFDMYCSIQEITNNTVSKFNCEKNIIKKIVTDIHIEFMGFEYNLDSRYISYINLSHKKNFGDYFEYDLDKYIEVTFDDDEKKIEFNEFYQIFSTETKFINVYGDGGIGKTNLLLILWKNTLDKHIKNLPIYIDFSKEDMSIENHIEKYYCQQMTTYLDQENKIVLLIDGQNTISSKDIKKIENFIEKYGNKIKTVVITSRKKINFQKINLGQQGFKYRNIKINQLTKEDIINYLGEVNNISDDLFEILKTPIYLVMYKKYLDGILNYPKGEQNIINNHFYTRITKPVQVIWNYNKQQADRYFGEENDEIFLKIIPFIGYQFVKTLHKKISNQDMIKFINDYANISGRDIDCKEILRKIVDTGILQEVSSNILTNKEYYFSHDYLKEFFAAVNLLNNDLVYCFNGTNKLLKHNDNPIVMRDMDLNSKYVEFYVDLFDEEIIDKLKKIYNDSELLGNVLGDIYCYDLYLIDKNNCETNKLDKIIPNIQRYIKGASLFSNSEHFGIWAKAYYYITLVSIYEFELKRLSDDNIKLLYDCTIELFDGKIARLEKIDKNIIEDNIKIYINTALKLMHQCAFDLEDREKFLQIDELKQLMINTKNKQYPVPKIFNLLGKIYKDYDSSEDNIEKMLLIYQRGADLGVFYSANILGAFYEKEAFKALCNYSKKGNKCAICRLSTYLMDMGENQINKIMKENFGINNDTLLNLKEKLDSLDCNGKRISKAKYFWAKKINIDVNIDKMSLKQCLEEGIEDVINKEMRAFEYFYSSLLLGEKWAVRKVCEYLIKRDEDGKMYSKIKGENNKNRYKYALEKLEAIKYSNVNGIDHWIEQCEYWGEIINE